MILSILIILWSLTAFALQAKVPFVGEVAWKKVLYKIVTVPAIVSDFVVDKFPDKLASKIADWFAK